MKATIERVISPVTKWWLSLSAASSDAFLYLASGLFALLIGLVSSEPAQWHWGYISFTGYFFASAL